MLPVGVGSCKFQEAALGQSAALNKNAFIMLSIKESERAEPDQSLGTVALVRCWIVEFSGAFLKIHEVSVLHLPPKLDSWCSCAFKKLILDRILYQKN